MDNLLLTHTSHLWLFTLMVLGITAVPGMDMAFVVVSALAGSAGPPHCPVVQGIHPSNPRASRHCFTSA